ncbi:Threonyl/alanyl tRNA synthetase [Protomyces lactucae-debilis]|uniref:Threonyl/alanyl tRNA synthetase n=1 Tax=Protomyces lactucae-debilis TaxID=2754530 RepID=A0A1Y2FVH3_PROLT|nr:Threonyl/alanyl tRNA synthetase [Protomyces lactucae-debilis]ORY87992.1 Threonyl/alanyl tRNA synthetase [Protomyces lactucae-debilis]
MTVEQLTATASSLSLDGRKIVGNLACQHDTYATHMTSTVCQCDKVKKAKPDEACEVQLMDTILFPEGGGQPFDTGLLKTSTDSYRVNRVMRRGLQAIHYTAKPISVGETVDIEVDWPRRWDHAQQHSGQHLVSAVLDMLEIPTLAWSMTPEWCYVEVATLPKDFRWVEDKCNEIIRQNLPITVHETKEKPANLPDDYDASAGVVRIVSIGGIDQNPCCGTHVRSTSELNAITILHTSGIRGTNFRIHFVCGDRCRKMLSESHAQARTLGAQLSCQSHDLPDKVTLLQTQLRDALRRERGLKAEVVTMESTRMAEELQQVGKSFMYRENADVEFLNSVLNALPKDFVGACILVAGNKASGGQVLIASNDSERLKALGEAAKQRVPTLKGGGRATRFQGKVPSLLPKDVEELALIL